MIVNLPNILTLSRLLLIPVFIYPLLTDGFFSQWVAAVAFGIAAGTDWFDGFLARKMNQETEFGKIADPLVDRILVISAVFTLYIKLAGAIPLWAILLIVLRDLMMVGGWLFIFRQGKRMQVTYAGKVATALLMIAFFILFTSVLLSSEILELAGVGIFYVGLVISLASGLNYLKSGTTILRSNQPKG